MEIMELSGICVDTNVLIAFLSLYRLLSLTPA